MVNEALYKKLHTVRSRNAKPCRPHINPTPWDKLEQLSTVNYVWASLGGMDSVPIHQCLLHFFQLKQHLIDLHQCLNKVKPEIISAQFFCFLGPKNLCQSFCTHLLLRRYTQFSPYWLIYNIQCVNHFKGFDIRDDFVILNPTRMHRRFYRCHGNRCPNQCSNASVGFYTGYALTQNESTK